MIYDVQIDKGLGPIHFGMNPKEVLSVFQEPTVYEERMGGNLNDSITFHGIICRFNTIDTNGTLSEDSQLDEITIYNRDDVLLFGKEMNQWDMLEINNTLVEMGYIPDVISPDYIDIEGLELGFDNTVDLSFIRISKKIE